MMTDKRKMNNKARLPLPVIVFLAAFLLLVLAGCGAGKEQPVETQPTATLPVEVQVTQPAEEQPEETPPREE